MVRSSELARVQLMELNQFTELIHNTCVGSPDYLIVCKVLSLSGP